MLRSRNLDDQTFNQIMDAALGALPWICPTWTDHNAHDPGVTILELLAWYKEMQQYHLNTVTDAMRKKLLKLVGVTCARETPARCFIELPDGHGDYPAGARLEGFDAAFELDRAVTSAARFDKVYLTGERRDIAPLLGQPNIYIAPFDGGDMLLGFSDLRGAALELWFDVADDRPVPRNPFSSPGQLPREIVWSVEGLGELRPDEDETHALSQSGYIRFTLPETWPTVALEGAGEGKFLRARLTDAGCEETVRIGKISCGRVPVTQQETWASLSAHTLSGKRASVVLSNALSQSGRVFAFLRDSGWRQTECTVKNGKVSLDASGAARDGLPNVLLVTADPVRADSLFFPSTGLPGMRLPLTLYGKQVLTDRLSLICDTAFEDGVRPAPWRYVEDLAACGKRDAAFTCDPVREELVFGDGEHGMIVPAGENSVLISSFALSYCGGGNIPRGELSFADGETVENTAASGGRDRETIDQAARAFLLKLNEPLKCVSAADYERAARATPGLRVLYARALPSYDPDEPAHTSRIPVVTVVVVPDSPAERPMPDARFLNTVREHLERLRPICTCVKVVPPIYAEIGVSLRLRDADGGAAEQARAAIVEYLRLSPARGVGDRLVKNDLIAALMRQSSILAVERLELHPLSSGCRLSPEGDLELPRTAVAFLRTLNIFVK